MKVKAEKRVGINEILIIRTPWGRTGNTVLNTGKLLLNAMKFEFKLIHVLFFSSTRTSFHCFSLVLLSFVNVYNNLPQLVSLIMRRRESRNMMMSEGTMPEMLLFLVLVWRSFQLRGWDRRLSFFFFCSYGYGLF